MTVAEWLFSYAGDQRPTMLALGLDGETKEEIIGIEIFTRAFALERGFPYCLHLDAVDGEGNQMTRLVNSSEQLWWIE